MNRTCCFCATCAAAVMSSSATGQPLTESDWQSVGDGLLTNDTLTGLQWLDWSVTDFRSYDDVSSELGPGGEFEGFRYATYDEVFELYQHAGVVNIGDPIVVDPANVPGNTVLRDLLGQTFSFGGEAIYDRDSTSGTRWVTAFNFSTGSSSMSLVEVPEALSVSSIGSALVRVPAPGSAVVFGLGGLLVTRRRRF